MLISACCTSFIDFFYTYLPISFYNSNNKQTLISLNIDISKPCNFSCILWYLQHLSPATSSERTTIKKEVNIQSLQSLQTLNFTSVFLFLFIFIQHICSINAVYIQRGNVLPLRQLMPLSYKNNFLNSAHRVQNHYTPSLFPPAVSYTLINSPQLLRQV